MLYLMWGNYQDAKSWGSHVLLFVKIHTIPGIATLGTLA